MKKKYNSYKRLGLGEVQAIFKMRSDRYTVQRISELLNRSKSTISNVLNKYKSANLIVWRKMCPYTKAKYVYDKLEANRRRQGRRGYLTSQVIRDHVISKLIKEQWSPEQISNSMESVLGKKVCTKTIYNFTKYERVDLKQYLSERGKPRRQRVCHRRGRFKQAAPLKRSVDERPIEANQRLEPGHWEADTLHTCKGGSKTILSIRDRSTRKSFFQILPDLKAETMLPALRAFLENLPSDLRKSFTLDNGPEFAISELIKLEGSYPGLKLYYCDPYCAWQKGSVENSNKGFRWYVPKGTDFATLTKEELQAIADKLNNRPLKCQNWVSAEQAFAKILAAA